MERIQPLTTLTAAMRMLAISLIMVSNLFALSLFIDDLAHAHNGHHQLGYHHFEK